MLTEAASFHNCGSVNSQRMAEMALAMQAHAMVLQPPSVLSCNVLSCSQEPQASMQAKTVGLLFNAAHDRLMLKPGFYAFAT